MVIKTIYRERERLIAVNDDYHYYSYYYYRGRRSAGIADYSLISPSLIN